MILVLIVVEIYGQVLVYYTENDETVEKFDCIYHTYDDGTEIPYCRRPDSHQSLLFVRKKQEGGYFLTAFYRN